MRKGVQNLSHTDRLCDAPGHSDTRGLLRGNDSNPRESQVLAEMSIRTHDSAPQDHAPESEALPAILNQTASGRSGT
jgi:hypothetical protein